MIQWPFLAGRSRLAQLNKFSLLSGHGISQTIRTQSEIVPSLPLERQFFDRRHLLVAARRGQLQLRRAILQRLKNKLGRHFVRAALSIDQLEGIGLARVERKTLQASNRLVTLGEQGND